MPFFRGIISEACFIANFYKVFNKSMNHKGSHGLHQDTFKLQTMTALIKSFCRGVQGGQFFQKAPPLVAEGRKNEKAV
jgi:hypothetical protein